MIRHVFHRRFLLAVMSLMAGTSLTFGQDPLSLKVPPKELPKNAQPNLGAGAPVLQESISAPRVAFTESSGRSIDYLAGNHQFSNFIGFMSNPIQSIDPRSMTVIWPMFGAAWASGNNQLLPSGDMQLYGAGLTVALSDRLAVGMNQGGYATAHFSSDRQQLLRARGLPVREHQRGGARNGWLNLGGFVQYTLIADAPNQFILTAGMRWEAPSGATQMFQGGDSPTYLAPYLTVGKEYGHWHVLANTGFEFPVGGTDLTTNTFYLNLHVDRQFGWLYPLIELNGAYRTSTVDFNIATPRHGLIDMGTFTASGNSLVLAVGANAVLIPSKLEFGAVYTRPVASQGHFDVNGVLVKLLYRY